VAPSACDPDAMCVEHNALVVGGGCNCLGKGNQMFIDFNQLVVEDMVGVGRT